MAEAKAQMTKEHDNAMAEAKAQMTQEHDNAMAEARDEFLQLKITLTDDHAREVAKVKQQLAKAYEIYREYNQEVQTKQELAEQKHAAALAQMQEQLSNDHA